jgi:hypothetical protein
MEIKEQLTDSGAVIGYRPDLKYEKTSKSKESGISIINEYINNNTSYTNTIQSYLNNQPSVTITNISDNIISINNIIDKLAETFNRGEYDKYSNIETFIEAIESGNTVYANDFFQYHKTDISKSQIPEVIQILENEKEKLTVFNETLKTLYYGISNITDEECKEKDSEIISVLTQKDKQDKGINYLTLSYDSILNKSINTYSSKIDGACIQLEEVAYVEDDSDINNPIILPMVKQLFEEVDNEINARTDSYNMQQSVDTTRKALYNYYIKRSDLNEFYNVVAETSSDGSYLISKISSFENKLDDAIENINRVMLGNVYYIESMSNLMTEKQQLRSLYATISYT